MNKAFILAVVTSLFLVACNKQEVAQIITEEPVSEVDIVETSSPTLQEEKVETQTALSSNYEEYNEGSLGEAENTVIFFHAPYCGSCTQTDKNLKETGLGDDVKVLKTDFDTSLELRKKYGVTKYHTFVQVDSEGSLIKKWSGSMDAQDITENVEVGTEETMMKDDSQGDTMMKKEETTDEAMMKDEEEEVMMEKELPVIEKDAMEEQIALAGTYTDYNDSLVGATKNTVIFFHAQWCPSCVALDKGIKGSDVPSGLTILKADFDSETELRKKYGVVSQHTLVQIDADGNEVKKWAGGSTVDSIVERLN